MAPTMTEMFFVHKNTETGTELVTKWVVPMVSPEYHCHGPVNRGTNVDSDLPVWEWNTQTNQPTGNLCLYE